ncbi:DUF2283 domain-containing protein [Lentzea flava]|uniref:DUF2283 domain-containing protein n=1 Tax=Lentzea flava TaxID=103732 RepID=A0ABQ2V9I9_9PSEU|nr:DUF2283 domain-containing protein [Lentzea flava]MCP2204217.1 Protein of unknown function (DUF2283) [Lentzea flava]GGU75492.1 hypothetical protein GCM10010178_78530 [Lentzea flava]
MFTFIAKWDREADAAYIGFREIRPGEAVKQLAVSDEDGTTAAVLDFGADGELLGIELFDPERQMPTELRDWQGPTPRE